MHPVPGSSPSAWFGTLPVRVPLVALLFKIHIPASQIVHSVRILLLLPNTISAGDSSTLRTVSNMIRAPSWINWPHGVQICCQVYGCRENSALVFFLHFPHKAVSTIQKHNEGSAHNLLRFQPAFLFLSRILRTAAYKRAGFYSASNAIVLAWAAPSISRQCQSADCNRQSHGRQNRETAAHVIRYDKGLIPFFRCQILMAPFALSVVA